MRGLFIGNSHTHVNDVPGSVKTLLAWTLGGPVTCDACTTDSVGLAWHWRSANSQARLAAASYDFVVLQERSGGPTEEPASTETHAALWCSAVVKAGARPVLYATWALAHDVSRQPVISRLYRNIAMATGAALAPVGDAWALARARMPDVSLYDEDGRHAAPAGSYLAAAVIARTLLGQSGPGASWPVGEIPGPRQVQAAQRAALFALAGQAVAGAHT